MTDQTRDTSPEVLEAVAKMQNVIETAFSELLEFTLHGSGPTSESEVAELVRKHTLTAITAYESATAPKWNNTPPDGDGKLIFAESGKKEELWLVEGKVYWHDGNFLWSGPIQTPEGE